MNATANIRREVFDAVTTGLAYIYSMQYYQTLSVELVHLVYNYNNEHYTYTMSRCLYDSMSQGEFFCEYLTPSQAQVSYHTLYETKEERWMRLKNDLKTAVENENYLEAARIRDILKQK